MLKTLKSTESLTKPKKGRVEIDVDNRAGYNESELDESEIDNGEVDSNKVGDNKISKKGQKTSKSKNLFKSKNLSKSKKMVKSDFFTLRARLAFTKLRQAFVKAPILYQFNLEYHIWIEIDALG